jgi:quinol monooxygenase YgiN
MTVIVQGTFELDPADRAGFLAGREAMMRTSRAEDGCLEYVFAADPLDDGRVVLSERWESQAHLDAHLARLRSEPPDDTATASPLSRSITIFRVSVERSL